ncbi:MAG: hypothetical protein IKV76_01745 [Clostridia bacterium]|nr:hypothetical protein [Clostridia bacterium]
MKRIFDKLFESGIVASILLGLAYFFAYNYQKGILAYYEIPEKYIDLSLVSIIDVFSILLVFFIAWYAFLFGIIDNTQKLKSYKAKEFITAIMVYATLLVLTFVFIGFNKEFIILMTVLFAAYISYNLIIPLLRFKNKKGYCKKFLYNIVYVEKAVRKERKYQKGTHFYPYKRVVNSAFLCALSILIIGRFFFLAGNNFVAQKIEYFVAKDYSNKIVAYYTTENYVLMNEQDGVLSKEYLIISADDIGTIAKEHIGALVLK